MNSKFAIFGVLVAICAFAGGVNGADVDCSSPPPMTDPHICCPVPDLITDEVEDICAEFAKPPEHMPNEMDAEGADDESNRPRPHARPHPPPHHHHHHHHHPHFNPCFAECVFNETEILDEDNNINEANLQEYLAEALDSEPDLIPIVEKAFQTCAARMAEFKAKHAEKMQREGGAPPPPSGHMFHHRCRPHRVILMGCVMMETFSQCPDSIWADTEECENSRAFFNACRKF